MLLNKKKKRDKAGIGKKRKDVRHWSAGNKWEILPSVLLNQLMQIRDKKNKKKILGLKTIVKI